MQVGHKPLIVPEIIEHINTVFPKITWEKLSCVNNNELIESWRTWLLNSSYNSISGLDKFKSVAFCPGTTDAFGEFIARYPTRTIRVSRSDFIITKILAKSWSRNLKFLEEGSLTNNDLVILSMPYSGNGSEYPNQKELLDQADQLDVPVFIDGAYFGISTQVNYPLDRNCVKDFTVSLSKNMVSDPLRLGVRFTKDIIDDGITVGIIGSDIFDKLGAYLSIQLLNQFSHNWLVEKYLNKSNRICKEFSLKPTKTFTLALGPESLIEFKRGDYVRVCITDELISQS